MLSNKVKVIANAFIKGTNDYNKERRFPDQIFMNHKRLQRLLYLFEIEYMKRHDGTPIFKEEFYAWPSGPVIPAVYTDYLLYTGADSKLPCIGIPTQEEQEIINNILALTAKLDTIDLSTACSAIGSPWNHVFDADDQRHNQIIPKAETCLFYSKRDLKEDILKIK